MELLINVINQKLRLATNLRNAVEGSNQFIKLNFNLSSEWDDLLTFAQFIQNTDTYNCYLDSDNSVYLPHEIKAGICKVTLYGTNGTIVATTNTLELKISENYLVVNANSIDITPTLYEQIVTKYKILSDRCQTINNNVSTVDARIDNIIAHNNDTSSNTELIDIRTGVDGTTYTSAGAAVRGQITNIKNVTDETMYHRNLFDYDNRNQGKSLGTNGVEYDFEGADVMKDKIYAIAGRTLYFSKNGERRQARSVCTYQANNTFIERIISPYSYTFPTDNNSNVAYVKIAINAADSDAFQVEWDGITKYVRYVNELKNDSISLQCRTDHDILLPTAEKATKHDTGIEQEDYTIMLDGQFYGSGGSTFGPNSQTVGWAVTYPIYVCKGDIIDVTCNGYGSNVSVITKCSKDGTYQSTLVAGTVGSNFVKTYSYTSKYDTYVCFTFKKSDGLIINLRRKEPLWRWETITTAIGQDNKYYKSDKTTGELSTWAITEPIKLNKGDIMRVEANGYDQYVSVISECLSNGACKSVLVTGVDNSAKPYFYKAEYTEYVAISYKKSDGLKVQIKRKEYPLAETYTSELGYYIGQYGGIVPDSGTASHAYTSPIAVPAFSRVEVHARLASGGAAVAIVNSDLSTHYPYAIGDETLNYYYVDTYAEPIYISASYNINFPCDIYIYDRPENRSEWAEFLSRKSALKQFSNILCIGDSLTQGFLRSTVYVNNDPRQGVLENSICLPNQSYPAYLAKDIGVAYNNLNYNLTPPKQINYTSTNYVTNAAASGTTSSRWYKNHIAEFVDFTSIGRSSPTDSFANYDAVFIFLGTNGRMTETNGVLPDTTGNPISPSTIITEDDDDNNISAQNTDGYCWIIELIKRANPNAKIFLVGIHYNLLKSSTADGSIDDNYSNASYTIDGATVTGKGRAANTVIQKIATKYGCAFLDIYNNKYYIFGNPKYHVLGSTWHQYGSDFLGSHFNAQSYRYLENIIAGYAGKYIEEHPEKYQM